MTKKRFAVTLMLTAVWSSLAAQDGVVRLPADPGQWLNAGPISLEAMKGKGAVLYFFEEG